MPLQRVDLLISNLGKGKNITPAKVVSAMNAAATQDVREMTFEPVLSKLLHGGKAPNARDATMLSLLDQWRKQGGSRLDRTDKSGLGNITSPGRGDHGQVLATAGQRVVVVGARLEAVGRAGVV